MEQTLEKVTPTNPTEQPVESKTAEEILAERDAEIAALRQKETELQAQKEHWRGKYDRDITSVIQTPTPSEEQDMSDEGKALKGDISKISQELKEIKRKEDRRDAEAEFPVLKDKRSEFDEFLEDEENKKLSVKKAAQVFLALNNLLTPEPPERKGLEKPAGAGQTPPVPGYTDEQLEDLRKNNYRKYTELIRTGKI